MNILDIFNVAHSGCQQSRLSTDSFALLAMNRHDFLGKIVFPIICSKVMNSGFFFAETGYRPSLDDLVLKVKAWRRDRGSCVKRNATEKAGICTQLRLIRLIFINIY